ncbi:mitotic spindle assembly checkpoint protein MAD1-like isoform X1 [Sardina pilchardus]|uniref:mitotic spindle assembly checkpoint protein MAD1-like isoform X1 n=1 Tax=Sardina pilchardus TaxID=27697 RepID=UPI002E0D978A
MDETGQNMDIDHRQVCLNLEKATQIITQALQHEAGKNQELCLLVFRLEEREAEIGRSLTEQMESNRQLKLKIDELKKDLEEKDNSFTQANQTVTLLKNKLRDLHQQLQIQQSNHRAFQELNKWLPCEQSQLKIENTMDTSGPENLMDVSDSQCPLVSSDAQRSLEGPVSRIKEEVDGGYGEYSQSERTDHRTESIISSAAEFRLELIREEEKPITVPALISEMDLSLTDPESLARLSGVSLMPKDCSKTQRGCNVEMNDGEQPENSNVTSTWRASLQRFQSVNTTEEGSITPDGQDVPTFADIWREMDKIKASIHDLRTGEETGAQFHGAFNEMIYQQPSCTKDKIPLELAAQVRRIYRSLDEHLQWSVGPDDRFRTNHNEEVTLAIIQAIKDSGENWGPDRVMRRACGKFFEHLKAQKKIELAGTTEEIKRKKMLTSRRDRLFKKRVQVACGILNHEDYCFLQGADPSFMSDEESGAEDREVLVVLPPRWRATRLTKIVQCCQQVLDTNRHHGRKPGSTRRRITEMGRFSSREPPTACDKMIYVQLEGQGM